MESPPLQAARKPRKRRVSDIREIGQQSVQYISTRGKAPTLAFDAVTLTGLGRDGGLYVPQTWPTFTHSEMAAMASLDYADLALRLIHPFVGDSLDKRALADMLRATYGAPFRHAAVAPLKQLGSNDWLLELFHGPTLAFKDFALQLLGRLFDTFTARDGKRLTIVGATSGDTGSAAIEATRGRDNIRIFMLHPKDRVSEVQRRQMTTIIEPNVTNIAVEGTFDDCQSMVKTLFGDLAFRDQVNLSAVNSINWARVMAQVVYYFYAALRLGAPERSVAFSVPTGNFGDVFAGYVARQMGLPIAKLVIATNQNDILARTLATGRYARGDVFATLSPSMDIQVASNFERILFDLVGRDSEQVQAMMDALATDGGFTLPDAALGELRSLFAAHRVDDAETSAAMAEVLASTGELVDPHTAVGLAGAKACLADADGPRITLSTAHPAKFGSAVIKATGRDPQLPDHMADLLHRTEAFEVIPNEVTILKDMILRGDHA